MGHLPRCGALVGLLWLGLTAPFLLWFIVAILLLILIGFIGFENTELMDVDDEASSLVGVIADWRSMEVVGVEVINDLNMNLKAVIAVCRCLVWEVLGILFNAFRVLSS